MPEGMPPESYAGHEMFERAKELFSGLDEEDRMAARAGVEVALKQQESVETESPESSEEETVSEEAHDMPEELSDEMPHGMPMLVVIRKKAAHKACPHGDE